MVATGNKAEDDSKIPNYVLFPIADGVSLGNFLCVSAYFRFVKINTMHLVYEELKKYRSPFSLLGVCKLWFFLNLTTCN